MDPGAQQQRQRQRQRQGQGQGQGQRGSQRGQQRGQARGQARASSDPRDPGGYYMVMGVAPNATKGEIQVRNLGCKYMDACGRES